jgi:hypothetical protein
MNIEKRPTGGSNILLIRNIVIALSLFQRALGPNENEAPSCGSPLVCTVIIYSPKIHIYLLQSSLISFPRRSLTFKILN